MNQESKTEFTPSGGSNQQPPSKAAHSDDILTGLKLAIVFSAILLSSSLHALDQTILATALPRIASDFDAFSLQGWISDSYILSSTVFLLFYGKLLRIFSAKWVLVAGITIFEVGSLLCGVSRNVQALIAGRTISGVGAAGIFVSMIQVISQSTRFEDRPRLFGLFGVVFGVSSVIGPVIGGAFTDNVTWRWCFYINLPIGLLSLAVVLVALPAPLPLGADPDPATRTPSALLGQVLNIDILGAVLVAGSVTSLLLALQWGGNTKPWGSAAVIVCFVMSAVTAIAFVLWENYMGDRALAPLAIFQARSIYGATAFNLLTRFSLVLYSYYIPIFYQAAKHSSATKSGIDLLPFILTVALTSLACGVLVSKLGYYWPFLAIAPIFLGTGSGLLYSLEADTAGAKLAGYQILAGLGTGLGMQNALLAMQTEYRDKPKLIAQTMSMGSFAQFLGGTIGLGVAEPVFASTLTKYLARYAPNAPAALVREAPTAIYTELSPELIPGVVHAYTASLKIVYLIGVPVAGLALVSCAFIRNLNISGEGHKKVRAEDKAAA